MKVEKDKRDKLWSKLEYEIQLRGNKKDKSFKLSGKWKKFIRNQAGFKIYSVNGNWIRSNLCIYFDHGGHGLVYEFIPMNELWICSHHYDEGKNDFLKCKCKVKKKGIKVSKNYFDSTVIHEITEFNLMKKGKNYWTAHNAALQKEIEIGLISDPYSDL
ncbi:MAG: hypothetical protein JW703_02835 [Candidatus Diapherotrites archaeon]|nr:hypothetical protein [Candidatus Diapherotrites archaeon]